MVQPIDPVVVDSPRSADAEGDLDASRTPSKSTQEKGKAKATDVETDSPMSHPQMSMDDDLEETNTATRPPLRPLQRTTRSRNKARSLSSVNRQRSRSTVPSSSFLSPDPYSQDATTGRPADSDPDSSFGYDLSIIVALVSPVGNWLTGGDHVKNVLLMLLLIFYLHQVVEGKVVNILYHCY